MRGRRTTRSVAGAQATADTQEAQSPPQPPGPPPPPPAGGAACAARCTLTGFFLSWLHSATPPSLPPLTHSVPVTYATQSMACPWPLRGHRHLPGSTRLDRCRPLHGFPSHPQNSRERGDSATSRTEWSGRKN